MKKRSERHKHWVGCSKAELKIFAPPQTFPGAWDGQNLISWRWSLPLPTNPVWWGLMHEISSDGNRPTNTPTNTQIHIKLNKFWPSRAPGKGVCSGAKFFGSALLQPARSVRVSLGAFFIHNVGYDHTGSFYGIRCLPSVCSFAPITQERTVV